MCNGMWNGGALQVRLEGQLERFRDEVREFVRSEVPSDVAERTRRLSFFEHWPDKIRWNRILGRKGWSMPQWPVEYGGCGWSPMENHIFEEECFAADAPRVPFMGRYLLGPLLYTFGTEAQKKRFLPPILTGDETWAQGFSEPNAGSDLAALHTRAEMQGDRYIVNGQKIWTTDAHVANWGFFLVRTDPLSERSHGLSFLLIDLKSPGVTVRGISTIDGRHHINEIFLQDVEVPQENIVGEPGMGWRYAHSLLGNERTTSAEVYWSKREVAKTRDLLAAEALRLGDAYDSTRARLGLLEIDLLALEYSVLRLLSGEVSNFNDDAVGSSLKVRGARLQQQITELQMDIVGPRSLRRFSEEEVLSHQEAVAALWPNRVPGKSSNALLLCGASIYGGSEEIQKNIIAKRGFGL